MSGPAGGLDEQRHARSSDVYAVDSIGAVIFLTGFGRCDRGLLGCVSSPRKIGPDAAGGSGTNRSAHLVRLWVCWRGPESRSTRAVAAPHRSRGFPDVERRHLHRAIIVGGEETCVPGAIVQRERFLSERSTRRSPIGRVPDEGDYQTRRCAAKRELVDTK
jgi:hypothetical protein